MPRHRAKAEAMDQCRDLTYHGREHGETHADEHHQSDRPQFEGAPWSSIRPRWPG